MSFLGIDVDPDSPVLGSGSNGSLRNLITGLITVVVGVFTLQTLTILALPS